MRNQIGCLWKTLSVGQLEIKIGYNWHEQKSQFLPNFDFHDNYIPVIAIRL